MREAHFWFPRAWARSKFFHLMKTKPTLILALAAGLWLGAAPASHAGTFTVTSTADSGSGSLRDTIAAAGPGDTIVFDNSLAGQSILLASGQLSVGKNLVMDASALAGGITIDAQ